MKDFMYFLITITLIGFTIGTAYLQVNKGKGWFFCFFPLLILMITWGGIIVKEYSDKNK